MKVYFAPLEGITGHLFRQAYERNIGGIDCYYTPFVTLRDGGIMKHREMQDILPENNPEIHLVPQIMTNSAKDFCQAAELMGEFCYEEVNLNLGCPSGTVVPKGKGAGQLKDTEKLDRFLEEIFEKCPLAISIKSRIGFYEPEEFPELLEIYNKYPVKELILHLRTREEFYAGQVHEDVFRYAIKHSKNPLCYNGDIRTAEDVERLSVEYPALSSVMIGRGFLMDPGFYHSDPGDAYQNSRVYCFLTELEQAYEEEMSGDQPVLFKMKEIWTYLKTSVPDGEKWFKKIKKARYLAEYKDIVREIFRGTLI